MSASASNNSDGVISRRRDNEERAKRIEQYYIRHNKDKKKTYAHFIDEGLSKKTIYHILRRHELRGDVTFKKPSGRKVSVCTPEMFDKLANIFKNNPDLSCREAAKQLGVARTTIFRIMAKMREKNLETHKVIVQNEPRCPTCHQKIEKKPNVTKEKRKKKNAALIDESMDKEDDDESANSDASGYQDINTQKNPLQTETSPTYVIH